MSSISNYLQNARRSVNEQFIGIDGTINDEMYYTDETTFSADGGDAPAQQQAAAVPTSQPYIIQISNASATAVANFDVLGAFQYLTNTGFSGGSLTISGVTISSGLSNINYQEFLSQSQISPFTVGMTYISSVSGSASQVLETITVNTRDANGNQALRTITPVLDPYQQQSGIIACKVPYRIDGFTKLTISSVLASSAFKLYFYPADNINIARGLAGSPVSRQYGNPQVVKSSIAVIGGQQVQSRLG